MLIRTALKFQTQPPRPSETDRPDSRRFIATLLSCISALDCGLELLERADFGFTFKIRHMDAMQLHELPRDCHRLFARLGFDDGEAADDFLRLGERAVGDGQLTAL